MFLPRPLRIALLLTGALALMPVLVVLGIYLYVAPNLPNVADLREMRLTTPMQVLTRDGHLIAEFGQERRIPVKYEQLPPTLVNAFIAVEDQRFFQHGGVDMRGLARAFLSNLTNSHAEGASTITMQVARNYYLTRERTISRKLTEIFLAMRIESELNKQEIMALYLNRINFSHRAAGVAAAAQTYYGKSVEQLELHEMAMLAGIPKGESKYNPISNPSKALERRNHVLKRMLDERYIDAEQYKVAMVQPVEATDHGPKIELDAPYLAEMVRSQMVAQFGEERAYSNGFKVYTTVYFKHQQAADASLIGALRDYDTRHGWHGVEARFKPAQLENRASVQAQLGLRPKLADLEAAVVLSVADQSIKVLRSNGTEIDIGWEGLSWARRYITEDRVGPPPKKASEIVAAGDVIRIESDSKLAWKLAQVPNVAGAFVALEPNTGAVLALVGGLDFAISQFNRVTQAYRQPGSNIKPLIYAAAFDKGFTPATVLNDAPIVEASNGEDDAWRPENDTGRHLGPTRLRVALYRSLNNVTIRLYQAMGPDYVIDFLSRFGFSRDKLPPYGALALGGASEFAPMEIVRAYAVFANQGFLITPYFIDHIQDGSGLLVFKASPPSLCRECAVGSEAPNGQLPRILDARTAYITTDVMKDVIHHGSAQPTLSATQSPLLLRTDIAGKTGTTNESRDAWFSGFNANIVATTWVGFDDHSKPLGKIEYGGKAALPVWQHFMETVLANEPIVPDSPPAGVVTAKIDPATGLLAASGAKNAIEELFTNDNVPTETAPAVTVESTDNPDEPEDTGLF